MIYDGKEFTDRLFASRSRQPTGEHELDQLRASLGIEHRLTKPRTPRTNDMVERFNGRIADVLREATDSKAGWTWSRRCCGTWPCTTTSCPSQR